MIVTVRLVTDDHLGYCKPTVVELSIVALTPNCAACTASTDYTMAIQFASGAVLGRKRVTV